MIVAEIVGADRVISKLQSFTPKLQSGLERTITELTIKLAGLVRTDYLSGQVLKRRTGRLSRSINPKPVISQGSVVSGSVGTNVEYAKKFELGFSGTVTVKEHLRMMTQAFGKPVKNPRKILVHTHPMKMNVAKRPFLSAALEAMRPEILAKIDKAVAEAIK